MLRLPAYAQLEITDVCNLRCKHCYHFNTDKMPKSKDICHKEMIQLARKLIDAKIYSLVITGGEPLARPKTTINVAEMAKKSGMHVSINTNLLFLTEKMLVSLRDANVNSLLVSCPASEPDIYRQITRNGDYAQFLSKLKLLLGTGISCLVNMVVTQTNCQFVRSTAIDMANMGVKRFAASPASLNVEHPDYEGLLNKSQILALLEDLKWCHEELDLRVDMLEPLPKCLYPAWCWEKDYAFTKRSCQAGRMSISVANNGDVRPCSHNPIVYGNLFQESLEVIWGEMAVYRNNMVPKVCKYCPTVSLCNGSCRTNALAITGSLTEPDRLTVGHMVSPKRQAEIAINDETIIRFMGKLRWREECSGNYSISSKSSYNNLMTVNEEMFNFTRWIEKILPLTVKELSRSCSDGSTREAFVDVLKTLIRKEFIYI